MDIKKTVGTRINSALARCGMLQKELAKELGVTDNTISYYCNGARAPQLEQLPRIAETLNTTTDYLLGLTDDPSQEKSAVDELGLSQEVINWFIELRNTHGSFGITDDIFLNGAFHLLVENLCDYYNSKLAEFIYDDIFLKHFPNWDDSEATQEQIDSFYDDVGKDETREKFEKSVTDFLYVQRLIWDRDDDSFSVASIATQGDGFTVSELAEYRAEKHLKSTFEGIGYCARRRFDKVVKKGGNH